MEISPARAETETLRTLPDDDVRQIQWRLTDRFDLQMLVQSVRSVARGPVARLVADGARHSHDWTDQKAELLTAFDEAGITGAFLDTEYGGYLDGPKNLALALIAFELAWVDAGAATGSLAGALALAPIHERGTPEQRAHYMRLASPPGAGEERQPWRGAFCLTEPLPYVGVETGVLGGKVRVAAWQDGEEPMLDIDKRGRFITNMGFANFVTAAVDSDDDRIKGSCMVILEEADPGVFDRGAPTHKLVHQLSSTSDPVFSLTVPASRIIGGYDIKDGVIVPRYNHGQIIEAVFRRTRVTVGLMTSAKLLSAIEPLLRYHRNRFRGAKALAPGTPRFDLGLQQREDVLHRMIDVWATGEASASLGFTAARLFDELDPLEKRADALFLERGIGGGRARLREFMRIGTRAVEWLQLERLPESRRDQARHDTLRSDELVRYVLLDSVANVLCPACKLWCTGHGANTMREAVSLMGGYGITEDCPGFLGHKWMDAQLEATYEGPEAVQRRQLTVTMANPVFLAQFRSWISDMREIAGRRPATGACTVATAMQMWLWTLTYLQSERDARGNKLFQGSRQGLTFPLADALCWLLASRCQILDLLELEAKGPEHPALAEGLPGLVTFSTNLCHVQAARAAGEVGRICAELVHGYNEHPSWDAEGCASCWQADELDDLEGVIPGIAVGTRAADDVIEQDGSHPAKAGPCAHLAELEPFARLRAKMDGCLTGSRLAKEMAADALTRVMIPETLSYPA